MFVWILMFLLVTADGLREESWPLFDLSKGAPKSETDDWQEETLQGATKEFSVHWNATTKRACEIDTLHGRCVVTRYPLKMWNSVVNGEADKASRIDLAVVDFCADQVDMRMRMDHYLIDMNSLNKGDIASSVSLKNVPLFTEPNKFLHFKKYAVSTDYQMLETDDRRPILSFPKAHSRHWPCKVDFRAAGWYSHAQWVSYSPIEAWAKVMSVHQPVSATLVDEDLWRLVFFLEKQNTLRIYYVNSSIQRVVAYYECPARLEDPVTLLVAPMCICKSQLTYNANGIPKSIVTGSFQEVWRLDLVYWQEGKIVESKEFMPSTFSSNKLEIESSFLNEIELMEALGLK